ncbi:MAG TPA: bacitracin ABC transporter ATP-binding protein [Chitinophagaceae bacterium]|nr:bacitracin ABC transporter ATP-binding protein [Chitinophagaceae bacterium]HCT23108.1 bacitracin ABC transporter ATP-binding protein [Chitinophagaceae bacterium]
MAIVSVQHLSKQFGSFSAVNDLSFTVEAGDVYGFLGQNGAGKSTTIRMLMTLIAPTAGSIKVFDMPLATHRKEILQQIGAVIEKPDVYKYLSAYDNLRLFARLSGLQLSRKQLMDQLEMVGLAERGYDTVRTFSQGMKQRLGIAIALVHNPQLIVLDEPTNGLDPQGIADIRNLILRLSREWKKTVIVSSHLLSEIEHIATRVLIIDKGKKIVEGSAADLFDPAQTLVELTTTDSSFAWNSLQQSQWAGVLKEQRGAQIILQLHRNDIPELHKALVQMQIGVIALQPKHSLEDYFLQVTAGKQHVDAFSN